MPAAQDALVPVDAELGREVVLIPVKAFHQAKRRLGSVMADPERRTARACDGDTRGVGLRTAPRCRRL